MTQTERALALIRTERERQIAVEGYSRKHDDVHDGGALACAAAAYALRSAADPPYPNESVMAEHAWPWGADDFQETVRGKSPLRQLVIAGALIVAEIERRRRAGETA